jgi:hypothetical protein
MAVADRTYNDPTAAMINSLINLGGSKESTTANSSSNPLALPDLINLLHTQMAGTTPEGSAALMQAIFQQGMEQVPGLATTYAQAAGARATNNSPLQLAMQDMMAKLAREGALQLRANQDSASVTAGRLAETSKTTTQSSAKTPKSSYLQLLPFLFANAGKLKGMLPNLGGDNNTAPLASNSLPTNGPDQALSTGVDVENYAYEPSSAGDYGQLFSGVSSSSDYGMSDVAAGAAGDAVGAGLGAGDFTGGGDFMDYGQGMDDFSGTFGFAKGGLISAAQMKAQAAGITTAKSSKPKGYADGGEVKGVRQADPRFNIHDSEGKEVRGITYNDTDQNFDLLRGVNSAVGALTGPRKPTVPARNLVKNEDGSFSPESGGGSSIGDGIATGQTDEGNPGAANAAALGFAAAVMGAMTGIPGIGFGLNALGFTNTPISPISGLVSLAQQMMGQGSQDGSLDGLSPDSVAAAIGNPGVNAGGLAGLGMSLGLADDGSMTSATPGSDGSAPAGPAGQGESQGDGSGTAPSGAPGGDSPGAAAGSDGGSDGGDYATGGKVSGKKGIDQIPIMATDGEFMIKQPSVQKIGIPMLRLMNEQPDVFLQAMQAITGQSADNSPGAAPMYRGR